MIASFFSNVQSTLSTEKHRVLEHLKSLPMNRKLASYLKKMPALDRFEDVVPFLNLPKPLTASIIPWTKAPDFNIGKELTIPEFLKLFAFLFTRNRTNIIVPKNTMLQKPIMLHEMHPSDLPFSVSYTDITVQENSTLTVINFQDETQANINFLCCHLKTNAKLSLWTIGLGNKFSSHVQEIHFDGNDALCDNHTLYFGKDTDRSDYFVRHIHEGRGGKSEISSYGILKDKAYARYDGMIDIRQTGAQTDATLDEKTLLLSSTARVEAVPGLEIGTNDVKAGHSAGITRVDDEQLFYAAARGIEQQEAVQLIAEGFLGSRLKHLPSKELVIQAEKRLKQYLSDDA